MDAAQPYAKVYASHCALQAGDFIRAFHGWIRDRRLNELLVDVADYSHVHHGPGVLLISHESYYGMDEGEGRIGMKYRQRRGEAQPAHSGLRHALRSALAACTLLEQDFGEALRFGAAELLVGFDDRLHAPNDAATFERLAPELQALGAELFDGAARIEQAGEARAPFRARITTAGAIELAALSQRLGGPPA